MKLSAKVLHWLPRIICILAILFVSMFALDAFSPNLTVWQQIGAFIIHLIPSFILLIVLLIAWKWELVGGIIFIILGIGLSPFVFIHNFRMNHSIWMSLGIISAITLPFVIVGILFVISHYRKMERSQIKKP
jgi:hypothetical protein